MGLWQGSSDSKTLLDHHKKMRADLGWAEGDSIQSGGLNIPMYKKDSDATTISVTQKGDQIAIEVMSGPAATSRSTGQSGRSKRHAVL